MKKVSLRMCIACREMKPKDALLRVVRSPEGEVHEVLSGTYAPGRSAYVCRTLHCLNKAQKSRAFERALHTQADPSLYETLKGGMISE